MRRQLLSGFILLAFVLGISAQKVDIVDKNLRASVAYLTSDALAGRRTGESGADAAAKYVETMFKKFGLKPMARNAKGRATYLQTFPYVTAMSLGTANTLSFRGNANGKKVELKIGEDWTPLAFSSSSAFENATLVNVGYGISAPTLGYDDYRGIDVKGKIAVVIDAVPDRKLMAYSDLRRKATIARDAGAKGMIVIADVMKFAKLSYDNLGDAGIPVIAVSNEGYFTIPKILRSPRLASNWKDGVQTESVGDSVITTKSDGTRIVERANTIFTYKIETKPDVEGQRKRIDGRTTIKNPDGSNVELGDDILFPEATGEIETDLTVSASVDLVRKNADAYNVIGVLPGTDPKLKDEAVVIGAHYDHLGRGGAGSLAVNSTDIHHGADDNASGTSAMIEIARQYASKKTNKRTLIFIGFSGEEEGLLGSKFYVNNPLFPLEKTVAMFNMDMVGRLNEDKLNVGGIGTATEWRELVTNKNEIIPPVYGKSKRVNFAPSAPESSYRFKLQLSEDGFGPSDHSSFYGKQIPVLFFFTGTHADYHKPSDTAEKINYAGLKKVVEYVMDIANYVDSSSNRPTYKVAQSQPQGDGRRGFAVTIGVVPGYGESNDGMLLDGVRDGGPAALAGIKGGDKIIKFAGKEIRNVQDYTYVLSELKADVEYEIVVKRGDEILTLKVKPQARK
jgi:hypothetical protein